MKHIKQNKNNSLLKVQKPKRKASTKNKNHNSRGLEKWRKEMIEKLTIMSIKNKREQEKLCQQN